MVQTRSGINIEDPPATFEVAPTPALSPTGPPGPSDELTTAQADKAGPSFVPRNDHPGQTGNEVAIMGTTTLPTVAPPPPVADPLFNTGGGGTNILVHEQMALMQQQMEHMASVIQTLSKQQELFMSNGGHHASPPINHTRVPPADRIGEFPNHRVHAGAEAEDSSSEVGSGRRPTNLEQRNGPVRRAVQTEYSGATIRRPGRVSIVDHPDAVRGRDVPRPTEGAGHSVPRVDLTSPFSGQILREALPQKFKLPNIEQYDGSTDAREHVLTFKDHMHLRGISDSIMCRAFPMTLKGPARTWFQRLPPATIDSFHTLSSALVANFVSSHRAKRPVTHLLNLDQEKNESLKAYIQRFSTALLEVDTLNEGVAIAAMMKGLRSKSLRVSYAKREPRTLTDLLERARKYISVDEVFDSEKRNREGESGPKRKDDQQFGKKQKMDSSSKRDPSPPRKFPSYAPLRLPVHQILSEIKSEPYIKWPQRMKTDPSRSSTT